MRQFYQACTQPIANVLGMGTIHAVNNIWTVMECYGHVLDMIYRFTYSTWWFSTAILDCQKVRIEPTCRPKETQGSAFHAGVVYPSLAGGETQAGVSIVADT